jgi:hypothetical protein
MLKKPQQNQKYYMILDIESLVDMFSFRKPHFEVKTKNEIQHPFNIVKRIERKELSLYLNKEINVKVDIYLDEIQVKKLEGFTLSKKIRLENVRFKQYSIYNSSNSFGVTFKIIVPEEKSIIPYIAIDSYYFDLQKSPMIISEELSDKAEIVNQKKRKLEKEIENLTKEIYSLEQKKKQCLIELKQL